jgi:hypothetical protein
MESHICQNRADMGTLHSVTGRDLAINEKCLPRVSFPQPVKPWRAGVSLFLKLSGRFEGLVLIRSAT